MTQLRSHVRPGWLGTDGYNATKLYAKFIVDFLLARYFSEPTVLHKKYIFVIAGACDCRLLIDSCPATLLVAPLNRPTI